MFTSKDTSSDIVGRASANKRIYSDFTDNMFMLGDIKHVQFVFVVFVTAGLQFHGSVKRYLVTEIKVFNRSTNRMKPCCKGLQKWVH